jgi:hypothetical protein
MMKILELIASGKRFSVPLPKRFDRLRRAQQFGPSIVLSGQIAIGTAILADFYLILLAQCRRT